MCRMAAVLSVEPFDPADLFSGGAKSLPRQAAAVPLGFGPRLEEFGRTIRFLVETPSITGQLICLDGGQHLAWETPDVVGVGE